jgi:hypothetical protein
MRAEFTHHPVAALLARIEIEITEEEILADLAFPADHPLGEWGRDQVASRLDDVNGHRGRSRTHPRRRTAPAAR